ncbi:MAG: hypothetical protein ACI4MH_01510 [Candidatus Coproplasma sp.]
MLKYDVLVIFGGISNENEISIITGTMACNVLKKGGKSVLPAYISQSGKLYADESLADIKSFKNGEPVAPSAAVCDGGVIIFGKRGKIRRRAQVQCAINCCHGGTCEGGGVSGLLAVNNIPCASAGIAESAVFMDKYLTKIVLNGLGVTCAPYVYLRDISRATAQNISFPAIVKPCKLGSSIGVVKADNMQELHAALESAFALDDGVIVEPYFSDRREINCAAYMAEGRVVTSGCEEAFSDGELLSYDDKYSGSGRRAFPADLEKEQSDSIRAQTEFIYSSLNMRGIVRFDYIISGGTVYLSEVNTVPGSLSYYLLSSGFSDFYSVLEGVIMQALSDAQRERGKLIINTGIINNFTVNACKIK